MKHSDQEINKSRKSIAQSSLLQIKRHKNRTDFGNLSQGFKGLPRPFLPVGQVETQRPQGCSRRYSLHFCTSNRTSRPSAGLNSTPVKAFTGQASMQTWHLPQGLSRGEPISRGASVRTETNRTRGPNCSVKSRQLLPIHPKPARWAASL